MNDNKILSTKNYEMFKFRSDNREKIIDSHVQRLVNSISARNLLELRPIIVNEDMEVLDGQHRLKAAERLSVPIYYQIKKDFQISDIMIMNNSKAWGVKDYLNYYCQNNYPEYLKLRDFMKKSQVDLKVALSITIGRGKGSILSYKQGLYKFENHYMANEIEVCWDTIELLKKMNGYSHYTESSKFWIPLLKLVSHSEFDRERWFTNLRKMSERFGPRASSKDYSILLQEVFNFKAKNRIDIVSEY